LDETQFDTLARSLAAPVPRRTAVRLLAGGLLGGLLASRGSGPVRAQTVESCAAQGLTFCTDPYGFVYCADLINDPENCGACLYGCAYGQVCGGGTCQAFCGAGQTYCNDACVDTSSDPNHCGGCFRTCAADASCLGGGCLESPGSCANQGLADCGLRCVDYNTDVTNCGSCGYVCTAAGAICQGGLCMAPCTAGQPGCDA
jgi:hypothetical protein